MGLDFPSEAQWEYAARAGTASPWWTGEERETLASAANLLDDTAGRSYLPRDMRFEAWDDGYVLHAPVGTFAANAFGFARRARQRGGVVRGRVPELPALGLGGQEPPGGHVNSARSRSQSSRIVRGGGYDATAAMAASSPARHPRPGLPRPERRSATGAGPAPLRRARGRLGFGPPGFVPN